MATTAMERYSYAELKRAQTQCAERAVSAALQACGKTSDAQKEVFRAHVNDLCAGVFTAALRQYNPVNKEIEEPVDSALVARVKALEQQLAEKEALVQGLREQVPRLAAEKTRLKLKEDLKRSSGVLVVEPASDDVAALGIQESNLETMKETYEKTSKSIAAAANKLDRMMSQATETIEVVERAMKRPKTSIDAAMEKSPAKLNLTITSKAPTAAQEELGSLRSRLALQMCTAKRA